MNNFFTHGIFCPGMAIYKSKSWCRINVNKMHSLRHVTWIVLLTTAQKGTYSRPFFARIRIGTCRVYDNILRYSRKNDATYTSNILLRIRTVFPNSNRIPWNTMKHSKRHTPDSFSLMTLAWCQDIKPNVITLKSLIHLRKNVITFRTNITLFKVVYFI